MRRRALSYVLVVMAAICVLSCGEPGSPEVDQAKVTAPDLDAIHQVIDEWIRLVNANDPEGLLGLVCPDLEVIPPNMHPVFGPDAHELFRGFFEGFTVELEPTSTEVLAGGDWAFRRYAYRLTLTPDEGGEPIIESGHGVHIFHRQADGPWCLAKDIWNSVPQPSEGG
jgi:ketosteroid isomerase-like protein